MQLMVPKLLRSFQPCHYVLRSNPVRPARNIASITQLKSLILTSAHGTHHWLPAFTA